MANKEINNKQYQILDYDPDICGVEDGYIVDTNHRDGSRGHFEIVDGIARTVL